MKELIFRSENCLVVFNRIMVPLDFTSMLMPVILKWLHDGTDISEMGLECGIDDSRTKDFIDVMYRHITSRVVDAQGEMISARFVIAK